MVRDGDLEIKEITEIFVSVFQIFSKTWIFLLYEFIVTLVLKPDTHIVTYHVF